ncbi:MAG TPA: response regulator [Rudaea sp.]|nr:response regulator [Rudaea sp.]
MTAERTRLLAIEDDPKIQRFLIAALEANGYTLDVAATGDEGLRMAAMRVPDVIIVDLGLPDMSGLDVIRRLREWYAKPIIVLSARSLESDKVAALDLGADDYLTKPFGIGELLARLRVARRHTVPENPVPEESRIVVGVLTIDLAARRITRDGVEIHLTPIEYKLLTTLAKQRGKVLTHRQLLVAAWDNTRSDSPEYLRMYLRALRHKIEPDPARPRYLLTEVGVGYRMIDSDGVF